MSGLRASLIESENHIIMHSNLLKYIFFAICIPALFIACDKRPTFTPGQGGSGGGGGNSGGADYSGLTTENHPRIIMTDADVAVIKEKLAAGTDENLTRLHESVIAYADKVLTMAPLEYKLVGKRLLDVCTAASNRIISCSYAWRLTGDDRYLKKAEEDLAKVASFPGWNSRSTVVSSSRARRKARERVGSYLLFSMALMVCRDTPHRLARSSWEMPRSFRSARI